MCRVGTLVSMLGQYRGPGPLPLCDWKTGERCPCAEVARQRPCQTGTFCTGTGSKLGRCRRITGRVQGTIVYLRAVASVARYEREPPGPNPHNRRDDFSGPALRHGSLNSLFQVALYPLSSTRYDMIDPTQLRPRTLQGLFNLIRKPDQIY